MIRMKASLNTAHYHLLAKYTAVVWFHMIENFLCDEHEDMITMLSPSNLYVETFGQGYKTRPLLNNKTILNL